MSVQTLLSQALAAYQSRDFATAHRYCQQVVQQENQNYQAIHLQAILYLEQRQFSDALTRVQQALAIQPDCAQAYNTLGVIAERMGHTQQARQSFQQSVDLDPHNADVQKNLGMALLNAGNAKAAKQVIQIALQLNPDHPAALNALGLIEMKQQHLDSAQVAYERAIALSPNYVDAHYNLAWLLEQQNQLPAAQAQYEKVLHLNSTHLKTYYALAQLKRFTVTDPAFVQLERIKTLRPLVPKERADLYFALGKMYADVGEYTAAFHHYRQGNEAWQQVEPHDAQTHRHNIDALIAATPASLFSDSLDGSVSQRPVFIVGMPRSGTTLVEQIQSSHPAVHGAGELQLMGQLSNHFLNDCKAQHSTQPLNTQPIPSTLASAIQSISLDQRHNYADQYLQALHHLDANALRVTDKMPDNFQSLWFIALLFPNARVIHLKRHPLDNCVACYTTHFFTGHSYSSDLTTLGQYYVDYRRLMDHWQQVLPLDILEVDYETLVEDVETKSRAMVEFLDLSWEPKCLEFHANPRSVSTASSTQVRRPIYRSSIGRWKPYSAHLEPLVQALQPYL